MRTNYSRNGKSERYRPEDSEILVLLFSEDPIDLFAIHLSNPRPQY